MILLSWPFSNVIRGDISHVSLELVAELGRKQEMSVFIRRGETILIGETVAGGHECLYRGGMWVVRESGPDILEWLTRRNVSVQSIVSFLLADLHSHARCYRVPPEILEPILSAERMEKLCLVTKIMES